MFDSPLFAAAGGFCAAGIVFLATAGRFTCELVTGRAGVRGALGCGDVGGVSCEVVDVSGLVTGGAAAESTAFFDVDCGAPSAVLTGGTVAGTE